MNPHRSLDAMPEQLNPNGENWGLHDREIEIAPSRSSAAEREGRNQVPATHWTAFIRLTTVSSLQIAGDAVVRRLRRLLRRGRRVRYYSRVVKRPATMRAGALEKGDQR